MYILVLLISFGSSVIGSLCGIGGGVIIKPVLDSFNVLGVPAVSFLSGCTVLSMSGYSILKSKISGQSKINVKTGTPLALGGAVGGILGKMGFQWVSSFFENKNMVGVVQAACLFAVTLGSLIYTVNKEKITAKSIKSIWVCAIIGCFLGVLSSFLGIGGGPMNLVVLYFFFSMDTKTAGENSLYIIFFSQTANLLNNIGTKTVPEVDFLLLILMAAGGILGGALGGRINKKIDSSVVDKLFKVLLLVIMFINIFNIIQFLGL